MFVSPSVLLIKRLRYYCSVSLFITDQPEFFQHPQNETKTEGDNVTFTCNATGNPAPTFRWTKIGSVLTTGSRISLSLHGKQLTITNVTREDSGQYVCEATNIVRTVPSDSATLNVQCKITCYNYSLIIAKNTLKPVVSFLISNFIKMYPLYFLHFNVVRFKILVP